VGPCRIFVIGRDALLLRGSRRSTEYLADGGAV